MGAKVAVVGSYNVGLTAESPRLPAVGETVLGGRFFEGPGGKGSNQAIAAARLGAEVHFVGCVGQDRYGDDALKLWEDEGLYLGVRRDQRHTGVGIIFVFPDGDNAIVVAPGANASLSPGDVDLMEETISDCDVLLLQLEIRSETAIHAAKLAKNHGLRVVLNPAPVQPLSAEALRHVDVLTPNETEARVLLKEQPDADIRPERLAQRLRGAGARAVVLTLGKAGALVVDEGGAHAVPTPRVEVVDPTGAGDAFNGALAVALGEGKSLLEAAQWACYAGAHCATKMEVIPGLARRDRLEHFMRERPQ